MVTKAKAKTTAPKTAAVEKTVLVLRCCAPDMSSKNGFVWPGVGGIAKADDWKDNAECGAGLHGWLYGQGDHTAADHATTEDAKWLVVEVVESSIRMFGGKCKFPEGKVVFVGARAEAADYIIQHEPQAKRVAVIGAVLKCGGKGELLGGALSSLTGGYSAKMTGGDSATMTGGDSAVMHFTYWDGKRTRTVVAYVGEDGIEPNVAHKLDANRKVVPA
jgi:hypothetical protein